MASKEKEVVIAQPSLKRLQNGPKGASSSAAKAGPARRFGAKAKEAKYAPENWIYEGRLAFEFPTIQDKLHVLGVGYIFAELEECNLTLVRDFYANWDTSFVEKTKVKIRGQV
ncbi:hypothetical protein HAX54_026482, partial [Datura stramonium]|nr:hypothetical protein [Datura stramonium]